MAATSEGTLGVLMRAALALPVLAVPVESAAAEVGEVGFSLLGYKERDRMKITEPVIWLAVPFAGAWELRASALVDIVTGASPALTTNASGRPVQSFTGASISDRRKSMEVKLSRRWEDFTLALSRAVSNEEDYRSRAFGVEGKLDFRDRTTTLVAGYGKSNDRVGSADNLDLDERRDTREYLVGVTQVLTPRAIVQSNLQWSRGKGWYDDPYRSTVTYYAGAVLPAFMADHRPSSRDSLAWLTRYRLHFPGRRGTLGAEYRFYRDDWGIRGHAIEFGWSQDVAEQWSLRPSLRWYSQSRADFYSPTVSRPAPEFQSSDQRLAAFGGLSPSLRVAWRDGSGLAVEATAGYYHNASRYRLGGGGSPEYDDLRAAFILLSVVREF